MSEEKKCYVTTEEVSICGDESIKYYIRDEQNALIGGGYMFEDKRRDVIGISDEMRQNLTLRDNTGTLYEFSLDDVQKYLLNRDRLIEALENLLQDIHLSFGYGNQFDPEGETVKQAQKVLAEIK